MARRRRSARGVEALPLSVARLRMIDSIIEANRSPNCVRMRTSFD